MIRHPDEGSSPHAFAHTAVIVESDETLRTRLVPELSRSLSAGDSVVMVVSDRTADVVRATMGRDGNRLEWRSTEAFYRRLGLTYEGFRRFLAEQSLLGRRLHMVAEPDIGTADSDLADERSAEYLAYESVCNDVYAPYGSAITCLWDSRRYPALVLEGARTVHNHELTDAGRVPNRAFLPPQVYLNARGEATMEPPPRSVDLDLTSVAVDQVGLVRAAVRAWAEDLRFTPRAAGDLAVAATEVVNNGLRHGEPPVRVRAWHRGDTLVIQVDDAGGRPIPPDAGYRPPDPADPSVGRGLWLARQLADTVTIEAVTAGRTSVRLHFPRGVSHVFAD
jgi:anti-sigma regulatory factor (Ser/Thr protein kinase)